VLRYFAMIVLALEHAHYMGVQHRYIETSNVYLSKDKSVCYLGDFANETFIRCVRSAGNHCMTVGNFDENLHEDDVYGMRKDVYRVSLILLEMLCLHSQSSRDDTPQDRIKRIPKLYSNAMRELCAFLFPVNQWETPYAS